METLVADTYPPMQPSDLVTDYWTTSDCPKECAYRRTLPEHIHERHRDGSTAVVHWSADGDFQLVEFQDVLPW